jgi:excisionase family DNA binding protein
MLTSTAIQPPSARAAAEPLQPKYCSITQWCEMTGVGRRTVYDLLGSGDLRAIKVGSKTLIDCEHGMAWLRSRPPAVIRPPRRQQAAAR